MSETETFLWDGLALIQRGDEQFINEPHVGGGNPVASSKGTSYFNDALGTTVGSKSNGKYSAAVLSAFGEGTDADKAFFTGKPMVEGLGHAFWMRNYRAGLAKWQSADPMGYPDGWNQLAYCNNGVTGAVDLWGAKSTKPKTYTISIPDLGGDLLFDFQVWAEYVDDYDKFTYSIVVGQYPGFPRVTSYKMEYMGKEYTWTYEIKTGKEEVHIKTGKDPDGTKYKLAHGKTEKDDPSIEVWVKVYGKYTDPKTNATLDVFFEWGTQNDPHIIRTEKVRVNKKEE